MLLIFFTIKIDGMPIVRSYMVMIPETFGFILLVALARWPDNPCSSLMHLLSCCALIMKFFLISFILLKIDGLILWSWTTTLW